MGGGVVPGVGLRSWEASRARGGGFVGKEEV